MQILSIQGEHLPTFLRQRKIDLPSPPTIGIDEIVLLSVTMRSPAEGKEPIRFALRLRQLGADGSDESKRLKGEHRPCILEAHALWELATPFRMKAIQTTEKDYEEGGPVIQVAPEDEALIRSRGLLKSRAEEEAKAVPVTPEQAELSAAFVSLWDKAVGKSDYEKKEWTAFRGLLMARGVVR